MKNISILSFVIVSLSLTAMSCVQKIQENSGKQVIESAQKTTTISDSEKSLTNLIDLNFTKKGDKYQDKQFTYYVRGAYDMYTTQSQLKDVNFIDDFIPNYPSGWITDYISVDISTENDKSLLSSSDNKLSSEQKNLLKSADIGTRFNISVKYRTQNSATNAIEENQMDPIELTIIPETEAEYAKGINSLIDWLGLRIGEKIPVEVLKEIRVTAEFVINKEGYAEDINFTSPAEEEDINNIINDIITKMDQWIPAKNSQGEIVNQKFQLVVGSLMGC